MKVVYVDEVKQIPAIGRYLDQFTADHTMPAGGGGERNLRVDVLGRYTSTVSSCRTAGSKEST